MVFSAEYIYQSEHNHVIHQSSQEIHRTLKDGRSGIEARELVSRGPRKRGDRVSDARRVLSGSINQQRSGNSHSALESSFGIYSNH